MIFYLGTHLPHWLAKPAFADVPLFVSRRRLASARPKRAALGRWALDSGGFTELSMHGRWTITPAQYVDEVRAYSAVLGMPDWIAPQDWMCEAWILEKTGMTVEQHQRLTVDNYCELSALAPVLSIARVLQGWTEREYMHCVELYDRAGVDLRHAPVVGIGTICRRQGTSDAERIVRRVAREGIRLHAFGAKTTGLRRYADQLASADSMAWSFAARKMPALPGCTTHKNCANCPIWALMWRARVLESIRCAVAPAQLQMFN